MKIRSRALCVAAALLACAWISSASSLPAAGDPAGPLSGRADPIDCAPGPSLDPSTDGAAAAAAPEAPRHDALPAARRIVPARTVPLRPRIAFGNRSVRGPPPAA